MECSVWTTTLACVGVYLGQILAVRIVETVHRHLAANKSLANEPVPWPFALSFLAVETCPSQFLMVTYPIIGHAGASPQ